VQFLYPLYFKWNYTNESYRISMFGYSPSGEEQYKSLDRQKLMLSKNNTSLVCNTFTFSHDQFSLEKFWRCTWDGVVVLCCSYLEGIISL